MLAISNIKARKPVAYLPRKKRLIIDHPDPTWPLPKGYTWYALEVQPRWEAKTSFWLENQGYFCFYPLETRWRQSKVADAPRVASPPLRAKKNRSHRLSIIVKQEAYLVPLIPRLVVLGSAGPVAWREVLENPVFRASAIGIDGRPLAMRAGGVEALRAMSVSNFGKSPCAAFSVAGIGIVSGMGGRIAEISKLPAGRWQLVKQCFDVTPGAVLTCGAARLNLAPLTLNRASDRK